MRILVLNSGSSSIKYRLLDMGSETTAAEGTLAGTTAPRSDAAPSPSPGDDVEQVLETLQKSLGAALGWELVAVGHRVVHGGDLKAATIVDETVEAAIAAAARFAPLHNAASLAGIRAARRRFPSVPQVAVFDTAFHAGLPEIAATYPIPPALANEHAIRRHGFHGISCAWCVSEVAAYFARPVSALNAIIVHLGAGASVTAVRDGRAIDTSMGMTPLEGLMMQTRSGDLDPAIVIHLLRAGMTLDDVDDLLNRRSGVLAIAGEGDMRKVAEASARGEPRAALARAMYAYRAQKYIGAYAGPAWPLAAIVFTGGIGENDAEMRAAICMGLRQLDLVIDEASNRRPPGREPRRIGSGPSGLQVLVVPTNEELQIARETLALTAALRPLPSPRD